MKEYTVFEHLQGRDKGARFMTGYQPEYKPGDITKEGYHKVIGHYDSHSEALPVCNTPINKVSLVMQSAGFVEINGKWVNLMDALEEV